MSKYVNDVDIIDVIVRIRSLAEIDRELKSYQILRKEVSDKFDINFCDEMIKTLESARDLAEYCVMNDIPTNNWKPTENKIDYRITQILEIQRDIEGKVNYLLKREKEINQQKKRATYKY